MKTDDFLNEIDIPVGLESRLERIIDRSYAEEWRIKQKTRYLLMWFGSFAASIILLFSAKLYIYSLNKIGTYSASQSATIEDPEVACREAEKALVLVSENFNKGLAQLAMVSDEMGKANIILEKTFKTLKR
jgi:hypothetical protein